LTVARALKKAEELMSSAGLDNPMWEAKVIAADLLDKSPSGIALLQELSLSPGKEESFFSMVKRRINGEPLQHIIGNWDFFGRTFIVTPEALIPRPETELLVEMVLHSSLPDFPVILDAGTGSGVIGITLALEIPASTVVATDVSPEAILLARRNGKLLGADNFYPVVCSLSQAIGGPLDLIAANLPYIPTCEIPCLPSEVRDYDPVTARDGGEKGISLILDLVREASRLLKPGGLIVLETGSDQEHSVPALFHEPCWDCVKTHKDLAGNHRFVTAVRRVGGI